VWSPGPHPRRECDADDAALTVAGRHGDEESLKAASAYGLQVIAEGVEVPVGDECTGRFNNMPGQLDEVLEACTA